MSKNNPRRERVEVLIPVSIFLALAAIVAPTLSGEVERAASSKATLDAALILSSIEQFVSDISPAKAPRKALARYRRAIGPGTPPDDSVFQGPQVPLHRLLKVADFQTSLWCGPYLEEIPIDPWGRAYLVYFAKPGICDGPYCVVSAGANGFVESKPLGDPAGDDLVFWSTR